MTTHNLEELVTSFALSALHVLATQFRSSGEVAGDIQRLDGPHVQGYVAVESDTAATLHVFVSQETARELTARLMFTEAASLADTDVHEGVAELVNQIAGHAKTSLSAKAGRVFELGLPRIEQLPSPPPEFTDCACQVRMDCGYLIIEVRDD